MAKIMQNIIITHRVQSHLTQGEPSRTCDLKCFFLINNFHTRMYIIFLNILSTIILKSLVSGNIYYPLFCC